jgi:DNA ligase-1
MKVTGEEDVNAAQVHFVKEGYEGTMIRDDSCGYDIGHRSNSLQKMKDFQDEEFRIVDVIEGEGSDKGCAIFICEAKNEETFRARIEGDRESSRETFRNRKNLIGKFLTVRFQAWTNRGVPQFPVGVDVRDKEDFS